MEARDYLREALFLRTTQIILTGRSVSIFLFDFFPYTP